VRADDDALAIGIDEDEAGRRRPFQAHNLLGVPGAAVRRHQVQQAVADLVAADEADQAHPVVSHRQRARGVGCRAAGAPAQVLPGGLEARVQGLVQAEDPVGVHVADDQDVVHACRSFSASFSDR